MSHLIASFYNVALIYISLHQCLTFLPLRSPPILVPSHKVFAIGFVGGNHFFQVFFTSGSPMPLIATNWHRYHLPCAIGWELPFATNIEQFKDTMFDWLCWSLLCILLNVMLFCIFSAKFWITISTLINMHTYKNKFLNNFIHYPIKVHPKI